MFLIIRQVILMWLGDTRLCFETTDFCTVNIVSFGGGLVLQVLCSYIPAVTFKLNYCEIYCRHCQRKIFAPSFDSYDFILTICWSEFSLNVCVCVFVCMYIYIYIYMCVCVCIYVYIYIYIYTCVHI